MKLVLLILVGIFCTTPSFLYAQKDEHGHEHDTKDSGVKHSEEENHADHEDEESHDEHGAEHGEDHDEHHDEKSNKSQAHDKEEDESSSAIGPDKGILEKSKEGFKLSPEAIKTFELKTEVIKTKTIEIIRHALLEIKNEKFIYRIRDGWIKKVSVSVLNKNIQKVTVDISQFKDGDLIITNGVGFVRTAELVVEEGVSHGHSH